MERIGGICIIVLLCLLIINMLMFTVMLLVIAIYLKKNIIEMKESHKKNIIKVNVEFSPLSIGEKRILDSGQKSTTELHETEEKEIQEDNRGRDSSVRSSNVEDIPQSSQPVPKSEKQEEFPDVDQWISKANMEIAQKGYATWIEQWEYRIGTGDGPQEVGNEVILKKGNGNIRATKRAGVICGVPGKALWKECDFKSGAYYECYQMPEGIDSDSDYEVTKIKECAILTQENAMFHVVRKGEIEVKRL